jgi:hypothetical protein
MPTPTHLRTPVLVAAAIVLGLLVVAVILLVGSLGTTQPEPSPSLRASPSLTPSLAPTATATDRLSTPEGAVRAFFAAFAAARRTDDPSGIAAMVTGPESSAYLSVAGFLGGQKAAGKASILTEQRIENLRATTIGATATVTFDYTEVGYDISLAAAAPLQTPQVLPSVQVTVQLAQVGSAWLVDAYESAP